MAKKKTSKNKIEDTPIDLTDWMEGPVQIGTPTMVLLPARKYYFKVLPKEHKITIPREGVYNKLAPEVFKEEDGSFCLLDKENDVMYIPAISKVLFAANKYPDLKNNQLFAPMALVFNEDTVDIIGQVIEILPAPVRK